MSSLRSRGVAVAAVLATVPLLALTISAAAQDQPAPLHPLPALDPSVPEPAPGETDVPPVGTAAEDDVPRTEAERSRAMELLGAVAECVRAKGLAIPDPVSDSEGVTLGWDGPAPPEADAAIRECDAQLR